MIPDSIRAQLISASKIQQTVPPGQSPARTEAIDNIVAAAKVVYPEHFQAGVAQHA
ncbi:hypothetical protein [Pseudomethylobacillus aquaticus]|uniref:hypothetical protein n=1 Tax=Pseudomethylobacillus aquaticus TaxID=2676064 RepID=UPI0012D76887|nr:hypothetical protein [Pseudomethylobacillus aquaticus]